AQISFIMHCIGELMDPMPTWDFERYGSGMPWGARAPPALMPSLPMAPTRFAPNTFTFGTPRNPDPCAALPFPMLPTYVLSPARVGVNPGASSQHHTTSSAAASMSATL